MFKVFIAEIILRDIILAENRRMVNSRSNMFKDLKSAKGVEHYWQERYLSQPSQPSYRLQLLRGEDGLQIGCV